MLFITSVSHDILQYLYASYFNMQQQTELLALEILLLYRYLVNKVIQCIRLLTWWWWIYWYLLFTFFVWSLLYCYCIFIIYCTSNSNIYNQSFLFSDTWDVVFYLLFTRVFFMKIIHWFQSRRVSVFWDRKWKYQIYYKISS